MALIMNKLYTLLHREVEVKIQAQQIRHRFVDWRMLKDYKKRQEVKKYGEERLRLNALRKNKILPPELQAMADEEIAALPRRSCFTLTVSRCIVTSRPIGVVKPYRVSRIFFRHLADYNFLAGWQRARW